MAENRQLRPLEKALQATKHPGNDVIPEPADEPYTFGGVVPWSINYARSIRNADGTALPDERDAFERFARGKWIGVPVEIPVRSFAWEGYHSSANTVSGVSLLAPTSPRC